MGIPDVAAQLDAGWNEAECTAALAKLEQLQAQVRTGECPTTAETDALQIDDLRLAIPRIIEPFHRPANPTIYKLYAQGVIGSQNGLNALKDQWRQPEMQSAFQHVKKSFAANADLSECVSIASHGWIERERKAQESSKSKGGESEEDLGAILSDEDISRIVVEFRKAHPNLKLQTQDNDHSISVRPPFILHFA
jgi:hypothetical protein